MARCPLPTVLLALPSGQILAASPVAEHLLCPDGDQVVGKRFEDFTADPSTDPLDQVAAGLLDGYEARRSVRRGGRAVRMTVWIRAVDGAEGRRFALVKLLPDAVTPAEALRRPEGPAAEAVVGSTDAHLVIDRISPDAADLVDLPPAHVVGQSLFRTVDGGDVGPLLRALARSVDTGLGSSLRVQVQLFGLRANRCQLLLLPMRPLPGFAFALLDEESTDALTSAAGMQQTLWHFDHVLRSATASRTAATLPTDAALGRLSSRELEITLRLLDGDRVPAIARALFLSPSTVRNHLSSVFRKFGLGSQQELIHLLRGTDTPSGTP